MNQGVNEMINQGGSAGTLASLDLKPIEKCPGVDASQGHSSAYSSSMTVPGTVSWTMHGTNNSSTENGVHPNSSYQYDWHAESFSRDVKDGLNAPSHASASLNLGGVNQEYAGYTSYPSSTDPYAYSNIGYQGYYGGYQQQTNHSYSQPGGAYQNTGGPYQPLTSFQNTGSYAGPSGYSGTYYNPGDYQTTGGYTSGGYSSQSNLWNEGNYANYAPHHYPNYTSSDSNGAHSSATVASTPLHYQQHYKQWEDYYKQTEVSCAPGTEKLSVSSSYTQGCPVAGGASGYPAYSSQPPPPGTTPWRPESSSSESSLLQASGVTGGSHNQDEYWKHGAPGFQVNPANQMPSYFLKPLDSNPSPYGSLQDQQKISYPQEPNFQYPANHQVPQICQSSLQTVPALETRRVSKLQIPTNPRIASNLALGLPKTDKDTSATDAAAKPAYISVSTPKCTNKLSSQDAADSMLKPGMFPSSVYPYVERALARCKDDLQRMACQEKMKEMFTKASTDGTLFTRDWDTEPLFSLPNMDASNKDSLKSPLTASLPKYKKSPSKRTKSRWEPIQEEKPVENLASVNHVSSKDVRWDYIEVKDQMFSSVKTDSREDNWINAKFASSQQQTASKCSHRPFKKQRLGDGSSADNGDESSDSDKEHGLTAYYSSAIALADSPEERKRRENRFRRFERVHGNRSEIKHYRPKVVGAGNLYNRRASALLISKTFEDSGSRAVEDIDWDALTVKGTCQEIEKRYLRLTSAPDPATVRPEEVLEKALAMVQSSQKNYLYKCDQLKSIRQDLTVQRIHNELTVKVYETHARLALEAGDLPEYNQCQSQLKTLYAEGIKGCHMEFSAYNLLCVILHSSNNRDLVSSMSRLSNEAKMDEAVKHALAVRAAVASGNYVMFFRLYKTAPNLSTCLMDLYVEKMRYEAVRCMSRSYRPTVPVSFIAQVLGFISTSPAEAEGSDEKDRDGLEECEEWLRAHGACLSADNNGEMQLDTKASSTSLYMPDPEDAVAHGDTGLAVNDFLTRTS